MIDTVVVFMKSSAAYRRVCELAFEKYHSYGKITGTVSVKKMSDEDINDLASFLAMPVFKLKSKGSFSFEEWLKQYEASRFRSVPFTEVVASVMKQPLLHHRDHVVQEKQRREDFLTSIQVEFKGLAFFSDEDLIRMIYHKFSSETIRVADLSILSNAFANLPSKPMYLPNFAQKIARNPHALDLKSEVGSLFYQLLDVYTVLDDINDATNSAAERRSLIFQKNNIVLDNIQNYISIHGFTTEANHPMWQAALEYQVTWNVPIKHIMEINAILAGGTKNVYIFENSSLFSVIVDELPNISAVCTHGQFRNASWEFFKRIPASHTLYYSGDFDPEGLLMCQTFLNRFPNARPLCMDTDGYKQSRANVKLNDQRIRKLDSVNHTDLKSLAEVIKREKKAGYQESLFDLYCNEIRIRETV